VRHKASFREACAIALAGSFGSIANFHRCSGGGSPEVVYSAFKIVLRTSASKICSELGARKIC
jgi:hypothetical protein